MRSILATRDSRLVTPKHPMSSAVGILPHALELSNCEVFNRRRRRRWSGCTNVLQRIGKDERLEFRARRHFWWLLMAAFVMLTQLNSGTEHVKVKCFEVLRV